MLTALRFYLNKALLHFLSKEGVPKMPTTTAVYMQAHSAWQTLTSESEAQKHLLLQCTELCDSIERFREGVLAGWEDFASFKMGYRNTVGRVYEEAHRQLSALPR